MADNVTLDPGAGGSVVATDDVAGVHYQIIKTAFGALDTATITSSANPFPVDLADSSTRDLGIVTTDWAGVAPPIGAGVEATALRVTLATDSTGVVSIDDNGGAVTVDWAGTAPPIGAGVEATALRVTLATDSTGVITVDNAGTFATQVDGAALTALQLIDDVVHVDDAAFTLGTSKGVMAMGFAGTQSVNANDACALSCETDGSLHIHDNGASITVDNAALSVTGGGVESGALRVTIANDSTGVVTVDGTVTANLSATDNAVLDTIVAQQLPATSGGISTVYRDEDIDETAVAVKASAGQIYWVHVINFDATPVYLHFYDVAAASVTVGTTAELCSFAVPSQGTANGAGFTMHFDHGIQFSTAIATACTTTIGGTAGPALNEVILNVGYK